jgi:WD40 repeat protein
VTLKRIAFLLVLAVILVLAGEAALRWSAPADHHVVLEHAAPLRSLAYSPDGKWLAWGGWDGTVAACDPRPGRTRQPIILANRGQAPRKLAVFPDSSTVIAGFEDGRVQAWDVTSGAQRLDHSPGFHCARRLVVSPNAQMLALASGTEEENTIILMDVRSGAIVTTLGNHSTGITDLVLASDGRTLASSDREGVVKLWDLRERKRLATLRVSNGRQCAITALAFAHRSLMLAVSFDGRPTKLCEAAGRGQSLEIGPANRLTLDVAFSRDDRSVLTAEADGTIACWDRATGALKSVVREHRGAVLAIEFAPDGRQLASIGNDQTLRLWEFDPSRQRLR